MSDKEIEELKKEIEEMKKRLDDIEERADIQEASTIHIREQIIENDIDFGLN